MPRESICGVSVLIYLWKKDSTPTKKSILILLPLINLIPHIYDSYTHTSINCGSSTLALLTGINPFHISALNKNRDHTSDKFMISFLKSNGFKIAKLTQCSVSNNRTRIMENNIKYYHVLLVSQLVLRNECSWSVINDQYDYHGFLVNLLKPLENL